MDDMSENAKSEQYQEKTGRESNPIGVAAVILLLCICGGVGVTAYMLFARLLKIEEGEFVFGMLKRLRHREDGETAQGAPRKRKKRRTYTMTEKISAIIEDSFCFRLLAAICTLLRSVWMNSIAYSIYAAICRGFKNAFENSAILDFLRANWDRRLNTRQGILPRFWHNLVHWSGMAVRRESNGLAAAMGESFFLRVFNQNFLIFCLAGIVAAIPVLPTMLLAVLVLGTFVLYFIQLFLGRIRMQRTSMVSVLLGCFGVCILYAGVTSYAFPSALLAMSLFLILMAVFFVQRMPLIQKKS